MKLVTISFSSSACCCSLFLQTLISISMVVFYIFQSIHHSERQLPHCVDNNATQILYFFRNITQYIMLLTRILILQHIACLFCFCEMQFPLDRKRLLSKQLCKYTAMLTVIKWKPIKLPRSSTDNRRFRASCEAY